MHATVLYRRTMLEEAGGFDIRLRACEDYDVYLRLSRKYPVDTHQELVAEYRMHGANMSSDLGLMLRTALQVLSFQRPNICGKREQIAAYKKGVHDWQEYYSTLMMERLIRLCKTSVQPKKSLALAAPFLRLAPGTVFRQAAERCFNKARSLLRKVRTKVRKMIMRKDETLPPQVGKVKFGSLRRLTPISRLFGFDRGLPIDRYYIEDFLARRSADVHGRMLEIGGNDYTLRFGGHAVGKSDVLHFNAGNPIATFVGDLSRGENLPSNAFDGIILTQTLHLIYDVKAAVATLHRILKPGGVLLMTVPGTISQLEQGVWASVWYWGFTELSIRKLLEERFRSENIEIQVHGNVLAATAFLQGLAASELTPEELVHYDPLYPLLITVRAQKQEPIDQ
jgi:SAM-dependent methyltransferase